MFRVSLEQSSSIPITVMAIGVGGSLGFTVPPKFYKLIKGDTYEITIRRLNKDEETRF